jgi:hypothetical protein
MDSITLSVLVDERKQVCAREVYEADNRRQLDLEGIGAQRNKASEGARDRHERVLKAKPGHIHRPS